MKKLLIYVLILCLLCGCAPFRSNTYVVVEPHDEDYEVAIDSNAVTVNSYLGLKNAITDMVEEGVTDGVIRAEAYSGDVTDDIDRAVYEIWRGDPLGAFAVDYMTYDCSKIVSYYELHIHATYRRTPEEIASVEYVSNVDGIKDRMRETMSRYDSVLRVRVSDYQDVDYEALVSELFWENPEFALEKPDVTVTSYPESGSQRILEIQFTYDTPQEDLVSMQQVAEERLEYLVWLYGSDNDDMVSARRFYNRLIRDGELFNSQSDEVGMADSIYGAIIENSATSYGYAQTYYLMLQARNIPCELVSMNYMGQMRYVCLVTLDEKDYYVDPVRGIMEPESAPFLMEPFELGMSGYERIE